jgi:hypothetical protein
MVFWGMIIILLSFGTYVLFAGEKTSQIGKDEDLKVYMAPYSGRIFLYNPKTRVMENDEWGTAQVSGNTDRWILEEIGDFYESE